jgi:hypothetical protein
MSTERLSALAREERDRRRAERAMIAYQRDSQDLHQAWDDALDNAPDPVTAAKIDRAMARACTKLSRRGAR